MLHNLQKHGWKTEIESMMVSVWWEEITQITPDLVECDIWYEETCKINKRKTTDSVECDSWFEETEEMTQVTPDLVEWDIWFEKKPKKWQK